MTHHVNGVVDGRYCSWDVLVLPLADDSGAVAKALIAMEVPQHQDGASLGLTGS